MSGLIGTTLMLYATYVWGDWGWLWPALVVIFTFTLGAELVNYRPAMIRMILKEDSRNFYEIDAVFHISAVPLCVLFLNHLKPDPFYFGLYVMALAMSLGIGYYVFAVSWIRRWPVLHRFTAPIRLVFALSGGMLVFVSAVWTGEAGVFPAWLHLISVVGALLIARVVREYVIPRFECTVCHQKTLFDLHCDRPALVASGLRYVGVWQGYMIAVLLTLTFMLPLAMWIGN